MIFSGNMKLLTSALAAMALGVDAQRSSDEDSPAIGCAIGGQFPIYEFPNQQCCSADYVVAKRDGQNKLVSAQCGTQRTKESRKSLESIDSAGCLAFREAGWSEGCSKGATVSVDSFRQEGICGLEGSPPIFGGNGGRPRNSIGCHHGRIYIGRDECCSRDYVVADGDGYRCGDKPGDLGPDNAVPDHMKNVPKCSGIVIDRWCPKGVRASEEALQRGEICGGQGCCKEKDQVRNQDGVCQKSSHDRIGFWIARTKDGCKESKPQSGPNCCPDRGQFRNGNGVCAFVTSKGVKATAAQVKRWRGVDGCVDWP